MYTLCGFLPRSSVKTGWNISTRFPGENCRDIPLNPGGRWETNLGGGFKNFYFYPYLGKIPILTNIFQMG